MKTIAFVVTIVVGIILFTCNVAANNNFAVNTSKPNIILVMSDDRGWGQVGYNNHPTT